MLLLYSGMKLTCPPMSIYAHELKEDLEQVRVAMAKFAKFESASRFCTAFDELRNYLRVRGRDGEHVPANARRKIFTERWSTLMTELSA